MLLRNASLVQNSWNAPPPKKKKRQIMFLTVKSHSKKMYSLIWQSTVSGWGFCFFFVDSSWISSNLTCSYSPTLEWLPQSTTSIEDPPAHFKMVKAQKDWHVSSRPWCEFQWAAGTSSHWQAAFQVHPVFPSRRWLCVGWRGVRWEQQ